MEIDFEKQIREMQQGATPQIRVQQENGAPPSAPEQVEDPTAVHFRLKISMLIVYVVGILGLSWWIIQSAMVGRLDVSLAPVYFGGAGILFLLGLLPMSITMDSRGIYQSHFLGLWEYRIPWNDVSFYWNTTRGELRKAGLLRFRSSRPPRQKDDWEEVVYVGSKSGKRYLLHTIGHSGRARFVEEIEKRGVHPKGYQGWENFMESRGVQLR